MSAYLIDDDILLMRARYNEALSQLGINCLYQFPNLAQSNEQGEPDIDSYSEPMPTQIFFDGAPKVKTYKRYGWVVDNDKELPFLIHCSWDLPKIQKDSLFRIGGLFTDMPDRIFRVTEITYDMQAPDHVVCQVIPVANDQAITGRTRKEISDTFNTSRHFLKQNVDYRGNPYTTDHVGDT